MVRTSIDTTWCPIWAALGRWLAKTSRTGSTLSGCEAVEAKQTAESSSDCKRGKRSEISIVT